MIQTRIRLLFVWLQKVSLECQVYLLKVVHI